MDDAIPLWAETITEYQAVLQSEAMRCARKWFRRNTAEMAGELVSEAGVIILMDQGASRRPGSTMRQYIRAMVLKAAGDIADRKHGRLIKRLKRQPIVREESTSMDTDSESLQTQAEVRAVMATLSESLRRPLEMRYFDGLPFREIACQLKLTPNAVSIRIFRGKKLLSSRLRRRH